jgi:spectinomycin phosphotransferase
MITALSAGWGLRDVSLEYLPIGAGSYHWIAEAGGARHFITVDDLDNKSFFGANADEVFKQLGGALMTAHRLSHCAGLEFVVAPIETSNKELVHRIDARYAVAVYPFIEGDHGLAPKLLAQDDRQALALMLARLHSVAVDNTPLARPVPASVPLRADLERALEQLHEEWSEGPYSEPARSLLVIHSAFIQEMLDTFDRLRASVEAAAITTVVTHGEPHRRNLIHSPAGYFMVDWDTVGIAPPERDLWMLGDRSGNPEAIELYRLRWRLDDISSVVTLLRSPHGRDEDAEKAWIGLRNSIEAEPFTRD